MGILHRDNPATSLSHRNVAPPGLGLSLCKLLPNLKVAGIGASVGKLDAESSMETLMLQAVIFDFDGVIVDSHPAHKQAWKAFLSSIGRK